MVYSILLPPWPAVSSANASHYHEKVADQDQTANIFFTRMARAFHQRPPTLGDLHSNPSILRQSTPIFCPERAWRIVTHLWIIYLFTGPVSHAEGGLYVWMSFMTGPADLQDSSNRGKGGPTIISGSLEYIDSFVHCCPRVSCAICQPSFMLSKVRLTSLADLSKAVM